MYIKTRYIPPPGAHAHMNELGYPGTVEAATTAFCRKHHINDALIRLRAGDEKTTVTEAVRRYWVDKHPTMEAHWPAGPNALRRFVDPTKDRLALQQTPLAQAVELLTLMRKDPDNQYTRRKVDTFIRHYGR